MGFGTGVTKWEFRVDADTSGDECSCFGAVVKPLASFNYDSTTSFMYRGYNGQMYGPGKVSAPKTKVRKMGPLHMLMPATVQQGIAHRAGATLRILGWWSFVFVGCVSVCL